jgi:hypothetical protein
MRALPALAILVAPPTNPKRLLRYRDASNLYPLHSNPRKQELREMLGWQYLLAWRNGHFPNFKKFRHLMPVPAIPRRAVGGYV